PPLSLSRPPAPRALPSFPTRRSSDLLGTLFRYRQQIKRKQELFIILTPHIVRNRFEAERILAEEGRRMDWILGDVVKTQGATGRSEEHTSELQSLRHLVCRLLLEKKK